MSNTNKYFNANPTLTKNVAMGYGWNPNSILTGGSATTTGGWVPLPTNINNILQVDIGTGISVGSISVTGLTFDTSALQELTTQSNVLLSGVNIKLSGISGELANTLSVNVINTTLAATGTFIQVTTGNVSIVPAPSTTFSNYSPSGNFVTQITGKIFDSTNALGFFIQNMSTYPLYVKFGSAPCSDQSFSIFLNPSVSSGNSVGGSYTDNGTIKSQIFVSGISGRFIAWMNS